MNVDITFSRYLLNDLHKELKRRFPSIKLRKTWVWKIGRAGHWEFHGPDHFYWHGRAHNAYDARYKGWIAYLERLDRNEEEKNEREF